MSLEIKATIKCDGCGAMIEGKPQSSSTGGMETYWDAWRKCEKAGWVRNLRYGPAGHFCHACADKPQKLPPVKRRKRQRPVCGNMIGFDNPPIEGDEWKKE